MKIRTLSLLSALIFSATPAFAESQTYTLDPVHTQITFAIGHMGYSYSIGKFTNFSGQFIYDRENPAAGGSVSVSIATNSIDMGNEAWNKHLMSADFFNSEQFPVIKFVANQVELDKDDKDEALLLGELQMLDVIKPVKLEVEYNKCAPNPMSGIMTCGFSAETTIKRSDWGMVYGLPNIADEVKIRIEVEGSPAPTS